MIKAIILDCFGVLTGDRWHEFLEELPDSVDKFAVREVHRAYDSGLISKEQCNQQITDLCGESFTEIEDLNNNELGKNKRLLSFIESLAGKYKLGIISNISSNWIRDELLSQEEQDWFSAMIFSFEVGTVKPDKRMFIIACEKLGIKPDEAIFVDDVASYCAAAEELGMHTVVFVTTAKTIESIRTLLAADADK